MPVSINGKPPRPTYFPHGPIITVSGPNDGGNVKLRCEDGTWTTVDFLHPRRSVLTDRTVHVDGVGPVTLLVAESPSSNSAAGGSSRPGQPA
jgi:hypothetical protein